MKIVFITTVASSIYGFRAPVIKKLIGKNHQVYAFVSEFSDNELDIIREMGVTPVTYRSNRSGVNPFSDIKSTFLIFKALKKISPDLVVPYFAKPVIFGTFAAKLAGVPRIVGMLEGLGFAFTPQPEGIPLKTKIIKGILIALYRIALPMLESLIVLNPDDKDELLHQYGIKIKNIHILGGIGLDLRQYPYSEADIPDEKEPVKFLFIGRFLKEKGIDDFIRAAEWVKGKYPETIFTVLGAIDKSRAGMAGVCQKSPKLKSRPPCLRLQNIEKFQIDFFGIEFIFGNRITCIPHQADGSPVFDKINHFFGQDAGIPRFDQEAVDLVGDRFPASGDIRRNHRPADGHCLLSAPGNAFPIIRRQYEYMVRLDYFGNIVYKTGETDNIAGDKAF